MTTLALSDNPRAVAGGNNPPPDEPLLPASIIEAKATQRSISAYLADNPVVQTMDEANLAKIFIDDAKGALATMEKERDGIVRPHNESVAATNTTFKAVSVPLKKLLDIALSRVEAFRQAEIRRKEAEAKEARRIAEEAAHLARQAAEAEAQAKLEAEHGVFTDVGAAVEDADAAFLALEQAQRALKSAEKATNVRIDNGDGRALSARAAEVLIITDAVKVVRALIEFNGDGRLHERIEHAIISAAREYRQTKGHLPAGVSSSTTRSL
jgi:hypothetical protein